MVIWGSIFKTKDPGNRKREIKPRGGLASPRRSLHRRPWSRVKAKMLMSSRLPGWARLPRVPA